MTEPHTTLSAVFSRVRTALRNILDNTSKYTALEEGPVEVRIDALADTVRISVRDYGPDIPPKE